MKNFKRDIFETAVATKDHFDLPFTTDFLIDNRAIGYRALAVGGRETSYEPMAEHIVKYELEQALSAAWMDETILERVFEALFPKKELYTQRVSGSQGIFTMPMIVKAYFEALAPSSNDATAARVLANILAEVTATALRPLNLILPFDGLVAISEHRALYPTGSVLKESMRVKRITEVLESLVLDPQIGKVKTLSAAALLTTLRPIFMRAGRSLLATAGMDMEFEDSLLLLKLYVSRDARLPIWLKDNKNLEALSTNLTLVMCSLEEEDREISLEPFKIEPALERTLLSIRESQRFSIKHLSEIKDWYAHYALYDAPGQRVIGLVFGRNVSLENRPQVTIFNQVGTTQRPAWAQVPFPLAENRIEPLLTNLFNSELKTQVLAQSYASVMTYLAAEDEENGHVYFINGAQDNELMYYAAALARRLVIVHDGGFNDCNMAFINDDSELHYNTRSLIVGTMVFSLDPAEGVIHSGLRENVGSGFVPTRSQAIPETCRQQLFWNNPDSFTLNLGAPLTVQADIDGVLLRVDTSLSQLLALPKTLRMSLTKQLANASVVSSYVSSLVAAAAEAEFETQQGKVGRLRAATHLANFFLAVGASPAGRSLLRSIMTKFVATSDKSNREHIRGQMRQSQFTLGIAMSFGAQTLVALEMLPEAVAKDALSLIQAEDISTYFLGSAPSLADLV